MIFPVVTIPLCDTRQVTDKDPIRHPFSLAAVHNVFQDLGLFDLSKASANYRVVFVLAVPIGAKLGNTRFKRPQGDSLTFDQLKSSGTDVANAVQSKISSLWIVKIRFDAVSEAIVP